MLVRRGLPWVTITIRLGGIIAVFVLAFLLWYLNPFRPPQWSVSVTQEVVIEPPKVNVPTEFLQDPRLQRFESPIMPPMPRTFGRNDPFASIVPEQPHENR